MQVRNTSARYGLVTIALHWLMAIAIFGLFGLGYYMVDLGYYDSWYRSAPHLHRSVGILLMLALLVRVGWLWTSGLPASLKEHSSATVVIAKLIHGLLYGLMVAAMVSGYLISTADGSAIDVFNWFQVPSVTGQIKGLEEIAGTVHYWSAWALVFLGLLHGLAAVKHHFIDRDRTLARMFGG